MKYQHRKINTAVRDGNRILNNVAPVLAIILLVLAVIPAAAQTVTAWYQPTPYAAGRPGSHVTDGSITNVYFGQRFTTEDNLQVGGWGDIYRMYLKFDTTGLPKNVTMAALWMMPISKGDASTPVGTHVYQPAADWSTSMAWSTQPTATYLGSLPAPTPGRWFGINISSFYNGWQNGAMPNYGFRFDPRGNANNFTLFLSSRYAGDGHRPLLQFKLYAAGDGPEL